MQRNICPIGWLSVEWMVDQIVEHVRHEMDVHGIDPSGVFGVPRGGLVPAVMLSHKLSLPLIDKPNDRMLWVDDIIDSGKTLSYWSAKFPNATYTALMGPKESLAYAPRETCRSWYAFPWEPIEKAKDDRDNYMRRIVGA